MFKFVLHIILLILIPVVGMAQVVPTTDRERDVQRDFIRHDTLPYRIEALPDAINTRFSEFSGRLYPDSTFFFTSLRADMAEDYDHIFETSWYCNIYETRLLPDGRYAPVTTLPSVINVRNEFNSNFCFNDKRDWLVYSRCQRVGDGELRCSLWESHLERRGWAKPKKLPASINVDGYSAMQPCLVETEGHNVLYFVSNRPQSVGGLDIWFAICKDGRYNAPVNLGKRINTEGNEVTPYYDKCSKTLYFSSDEHLGIGDYDIFYSAGALSQWDEPANMGVPFNSAYNDFYFTTAGDDCGFFSSNRPHDGTSETDTCCNDIFRFERIVPTDTAKPVVDTPTVRQKITSVLPITLYFQNDEPDPRSVSDTTDQDYDQLYRRYLADHDLYVSESGQGLAGDTLKTVQQEMYAFLRDSVATGHERLLRLKRYLKEALLQGDSLELVVSGYASPLHNSDYNRHLASRRIASLLNYLYKADNFFLAPYLDGDRPGLVIHTDPQGAVQHEFATGETRETVYGVQAAKDRKIVIQAK